MSLQNRVTPYSDLVAVPERGALMGNRGVLHDDHRQIVRFSRGRRWIACLTEFKGRRRAPMTPGHYTELFFLDEATALAAGHRPCHECRRPDSLLFREAWARATGADPSDRAGDARPQPARGPARGPGADAALVGPRGRAPRRGDGRDGRRGLPDLGGRRPRVDAGRLHPRPPHAGGPPAGAHAARHLRRRSPPGTARRSRSEFVRPRRRRGRPGGRRGRGACRSSARPRARPSPGRPR